MLTLNFRMVPLPYDKRLHYYMIGYCFDSVTPQVLMETTRIAGQSAVWAALFIVALFSFLVVQ